MEIIYTICWFVIGICFGSFYHVIGYRLPKGETLLKPKHSYCPDCGMRLTLLDLIPIFSFFIKRGKCRHCGKKISLFYPVVEIITGLLFALNFHLFGYSYEFFVSIVLASLLSIILVSDILYLIIPDEVIFIGSVFLLITKVFFQGWQTALVGIGNGFIMFFGMYLFMLFGNFIFKKETLGGADIKLMFLSGFVLGTFLSLCVIFLSSVIALPIAIILYVVNKENVIPYGPFLVLSIYLIFISKIDFSIIMEFLSHCI